MENITKVIHQTIPNESNHLGTLQIDPGDIFGIALHVHGTCISQFLTLLLRYLEATQSGLGFLLKSNLD